MTTHTKNKPRTSTNKHVHRNLNLVTPVLQGPDVRELQQACNALTKHYKFDWLHLRVDAEYGKRTARRAAFCMYLIGVHKDQVARARRIGHISKLIQQYLRDPSKRQKDEREREENRRDQFKRLRQEHNEGLPAAVDWMVKYQGVNENPSSSNSGPYPIDECQAHFGLNRVPWCGCCVGYAIEEIGGFGPTGIWWPHAAYIRADAEAGRNGLEDISPSDAFKGCVVTFFSGGDDHVAFVRGKPTNGMLPTVEGNTSSAKQDADGGIIELKERSFSEVTCVARLDFALKD